MQRTQQYVIDQVKEREIEPQQGDDSVPAEKEPGPSNSIPPSHLKPEAKPFFPNQTNTGPPSSQHTSQQPHICQDDNIHGSHKVKFKSNHATELQSLETFLPDCNQWFRPDGKRGDGSSV